MAYYDGELIKENFAKRLNQVDGIMITVSDASVLLSLSMYETPIADVAEVKHGKWLKTDAYPHRIYCSLCYKTYVTNEESIQGRSWQHPAYCTEAEYCPHCGAKMRINNKDKDDNKWDLIEETTKYHVEKMM